jgi:hypothetical protein
VIDVFKDGIPQQKEDAREEKEAEENEKSSRQKGDLES